MGQAAGPVLQLGGSLIGGALGGPIGSMVGGLAGGLIGSLIGSRSRKPLVHDYQLANSSFGRPIPLIYGEWRTAGTVIWESDIKAVTASFGKGFGSSGGGTGTKYFQSAAFAFVQGPARLLKIWLDGKLFYDATSAMPTELIPRNSVFKFRIYTGDETQLADPLIASWVLINASPPLSCPAYRGLAYLVVDNIRLEQFGNRMPNFIGAWATDATDTVHYQQMTPLANDPGFPGASYVYLRTAIDWVDNRIYVLNVQDSSVRMFDLRTGQCLLYRTWAEIWAPVPAPPPGTLFTTAAIAAMPGGGLYIASGGGLAAGVNTLWTLNPNTLQVINTKTMPVNPANSLATTGYLVPFQPVSSLGAFDMVARIDEAFQQVLIVDPVSGAHSPWLAVHWGDGAFGLTQVVVGKQDTIAGTVDLWLCSSNFFGDDTMYVYKIVVVAGSDPSSLTLPTPFILSSAVLRVTGTIVWNSPTVFYDASDDTLIITQANLAVNFTVKWSPILGTVWTAQPAIVPALFTQNLQVNLSNGIIGTGGFGNLTVNSTDSGAQDWTISGQPTAQWPTAILGYDSALNALAYLNTATGTATLWVAYLQRVTADGVLVADILLDLCERAGLAANQVDVSAVWQKTRGYAVEQETSFGSAIADLCDIFRIDMVESDYKLKFVPRGQAAVATIAQADLASIDADPAHYWQGQRAIEQELPLQINVRYHDPLIDYQTGSSYAKRTALPVPTVYSRRVKSVDLPLVMTNAQAHQVAETWLYSMWAERTTYQTKLGPKYLWLDPADNAVVTPADGETLTIRVQKTDLGDDYSLHVDGASEDIETYFPSLAREANISQAPQTITQSPAMLLLQFNIPLLQDSDDLASAQERGYYMVAPLAAVTTSDSARLYESTDGGATYPLISSIASFANWGYGQAAGPFGDTVSKFATDYVNTLKVSPAPGSVVPASITYTELMSGMNTAIVGSEIIQFMTSVANPDGTYTLSVLLRGRRGTEWATGTHESGETVVFVEGDILGIGLPLAQIGVAEMWKLVPGGRFLDSTPATVFAYLGYDLKPYAPVHFSRTMVSGDLVIAWFRRSRLGGGDGLILDMTDTVPLAEANESYQIYLLANASSIDTFNADDATTYVRSFPQSPNATPRITLNVPTLTYTAAMMAADGFDPAVNTLYIVGYQMSSLVGRGFRAYEIIPVPVLIRSAVVGPAALITLTPTGVASAESEGVVTLSGAISGPTITLSPRSVASTEGETEPTLSGTGVVLPTTILRPVTVATTETEGFPVISVAGGTTGGGTGFQVPLQNRSLYYLSNVAPASAAAAATSFNCVVVDPTADGGTGDTFWTAPQVASMRNPTGGVVLAYFDMGGAESFRTYYNAAKAAGILSTTVNSWGENSVMYWSATWQSIAQAWAAKAIASGFDGIYLDVADCYTDPWCIQRAPAGGGYPAGSQSAAGWWEIQFMQTLKAWCHTQKPGFQLWENAGEGLSDTTQFGSTPRFVDVIDGALREQVIYSFPGNGSTPASGTVPINTDLSADFANLARIIAAGKPVTLTEYVGAGGNAIGGGTVSNAGVASLNDTVVGSGVTNAIHWIRQVCAAWNCGYYISVADYNVSAGPTLSVVDTEGITTP